MWKEKLGFLYWDESAKQLIYDIVSLLFESAADYTIFWRQLAVIAEKKLQNNLLDVNELFEDLSNVFYYSEYLFQERKNKWLNWLLSWSRILIIQNASKDPKEVASRMREVSPKYIPREWMLVQAYQKAEEGDYTFLHELQTLFLNPYEEQFQFEKKYFKKAPLEVYSQGGLPGTAYMV